MQFKRPISELVSLIHCRANDRMPLWCLMMQKYLGATLVFFSLLLTSTESSAHLILAGYGSVNIDGSKITILVGVPIQSFTGIDIPQDEIQQQKTIQQHKQLLIEQLNSNMKFTFSAPLEVFADEILYSPQLPGEKTPPQVEWLRQLKLNGPLSSQQIDIELNTKALGTKYIFQVKNGADQEIAVITDDEPKHQFFKDRWGTLKSFFFEGLSHILSGFDHLLFILILLISAINIKRWLWVLSSFTLAHGMTYSLASQGVLSVSPPLVESVIALTIVITAIFEIRNFHPKLWQECLTVFGFGLFHGLGFASAMSTLTHESRFPIISILGFNLGIELGQLITSLAILLVLLALKKFPPVYQHTPRAIAIFSLVVGCYWFVERLLLQ